MIVNIWLATSEAARDIIRESLQWDEDLNGPYTGPLRPRSRRLFAYMADSQTVQRLFSVWDASGVNYYMWSVTFDESQRDTIQQIRDEIDYLVTQYPNQIEVVGAWHFEDGAQVGTRNGGDPIYPIPNWAWRFMPPQVGATSNSDLQDINLMAGQAPRDFG